MEGYIDRQMIGRNAYHWTRRKGISYRSEQYRRCDCIRKCSKVLLPNLGHMFAMKWDKLKLLALHFRQYWWKAMLEIVDSGAGGEVNDGLVRARLKGCKEL